MGLYFVILITLVYFYYKRTSWGFLRFIQDTGKEKKIDNVVNDDLSINEKLDEEVKDYKYDNKILGWIIIIYLIYGLMELLMV